MNTVTLVLAVLLSSLGSACSEKTHTTDYKPLTDDYGMVLYHSLRVIDQNHSAGRTAGNIAMTWTRDVKVGEKHSQETHRVYRYFSSYLNSADPQLERPVRTSIGLAAINYNHGHNLDYVTSDWIQSSATHGHPYSYMPFQFYVNNWDRGPMVPMLPPGVSSVGYTLTDSSASVSNTNGASVYVEKTIGLGVTTNYAHWLEGTPPVAPVSLGYFPLETVNSSGYFLGFYTSFDFVNGAPVSRVVHSPLPGSARFEARGRVNPGNSTVVDGEIWLGTYKYGQFQITNLRSENPHLSFQIYNQPQQN